MKLELCGEVLALHGGQDLYVYQIVDLFVWALLWTIARLFVCLFVFLLLFAYLLDPLIIFSQQIAFQIRKLGFSVSRSNL